MRLDKSQKEMVLRVLSQKIPREPVCSACHHQKWKLGDKVFEIREYLAGHLGVGGPIVPVIPVTCTYCGNTLFFNAVTLGIVEPARQEVSDG